MRGAPMVIVDGHVTVEPQQRESYLAACISIVEQGRDTAGGSTWPSPPP